MAQVELTVSMDSRRQEQIERFCALSGLSKTQTFNEMMDMWEKLVYIPWMDFIEKEERRRRTYEAFRRQREKAERGETPDLSMEEIDAIIAEVRSNRIAQSTEE